MKLPPVQNHLPSSGYNRCSLDPFYKWIEAAHNTAQSVYNTAVLHLANTQQQCTLLLHQAADKRKQFQGAQHSLFSWQRINLFVQRVFIFIGTFAGIRALQMGSIGLGSALIAASVWKMAKEITRYYNLQNAILKTFAPKSLSENKKNIEYLTRALSVIDTLCTALLLGGSIYQINRLYSASTMQLVTKGIAPGQAGLQLGLAQAEYKSAQLKAEQQLHLGRSQYFTRRMELVRSQVHQSSNALSHLSTFFSSLLKADSHAKSAIFNIN